MRFLEFITDEEKTKHHQVAVRVFFALFGKGAFWRYNLVVFFMWLAVFLTGIRAVFVIAFGDPSPYLSGFGFSLPYLPGKPMALVVWWLLAFVTLVGTIATWWQLPWGGITENSDTSPTSFAGFWFFFPVFLGLFWLNFGWSLF